MSTLNICENEMDEGPLRYVRCRLQFQQLCNLMTKSPPLRWAVNLTAHELLLLELPARVLQPRSKWLSLEG